MKKALFLLTVFLLNGLALLGFFASNQFVQAQSATASLQFRQDLITKEGEVYSLPIYLNTNGQAASAIEMRVNTTGSLDLVSFKISGPLEQQEVYSYVKDGKAYLSFTAANITAGLKTTTPSEVAVLKFIAFDQAALTFAFDQDKTMVVNAATDDNFLATYDQMTLTVQAADQVSNNNVSQNSVDNANSPDSADEGQVFNDQTNAGETIMASRPDQLIDKEESAFVGEEFATEPPNTQEQKYNQQFKASAGTTGKIIDQESQGVEEKPATQTQIILIILIVLLISAMGTGLFLLWKNKRKQIVSQENSNSVDSVAAQVNLSTTVANMSAAQAVPLSSPTSASASPVATASPAASTNPAAIANPAVSNPSHQPISEASAPLNEKLGQEPWAN